MVKCIQRIFRLKGVVVMESKRVSTKLDRTIFIDVAPGHFATNHSHINMYVDLTHIKTNQMGAKNAAALLAGQYQNNVVDTILCLEGTNVLGAFMAQELSSQSNIMGVNRGADIHVLTPELNSNKQMIFQDNTKSMIIGKRILLLLSSVSTGKTISRAYECLQYYNGVLVGICAGFSAIRSYKDIEINSVFNEQDIPGYRSYLTSDCEMCAHNRQIDALVNDSGYVSL